MRKSYKRKAPSVPPPARSHSGFSRVISETATVAPAMAQSRQSGVVSGVACGFEMVAPPVLRESGARQKGGGENVGECKPHQAINLLSRTRGSQRPPQARAKAPRYHPSDNPGRHTLAAATAGVAEWSETMC